MYILGSTKLQSNKLLRNWFSWLVKWLVCFLLAGGKELDENAWYLRNPFLIVPSFSTLWQFRGTLFRKLSWYATCLINGLVWAWEGYNTDHCIFTKCSSARSYRPRGQCYNIRSWHEIRNYRTDTVITITIYENVDCFRVIFYLQGVVAV